MRRRDLLLIIDLENAVVKRLLVVIRAEGPVVQREGHRRGRSGHPPHGPRKRANGRKSACT